MLGKRFDFFSLEAVKRVRPLLQVRIKGANGSRQVLEFRPGQRSLAAELVGRVKGRPASAPTEGTGDSKATGVPKGSRDPATSADDATTAAFWGEH